MSVARGLNSIENAISRPASDFPGGDANLGRRQSVIVTGPVRLVVGKSDVVGWASGKAGVPVDIVTVAISTGNEFVKSGREFSAYQPLFLSVLLA